ncbi:MAG: GDSL-type esterase/lipase family protein [bacterium]
MKRPLLAVYLVAAVSCSSSATAPNPELDIVGWGDSLIEGGGMLGDVSTLLGRPIHNNGVGGQTSSQILVRVLADSVYRKNVAIFWMGRNNYANPDTVVSDIAQAVAHLEGRRHFLVLSVLNGEFDGEAKTGANYDTIIALNARLATAYPSNFLDVRRTLVAAYNPRSVRDSTNAANDIPPASLRGDELHLNDAGNRIVAIDVANAIKTKSW